MRSNVLMPAALVVLAVGLMAAPATGRDWNVSTVSQLTNAVNNAVSGDVILVAPGTYVIGNELWMRRNGVTLRGTTGNPEDVFLRGAGMNNSGYARIPLHIDADYITVENITSGECYWHAIQFSPGADYAVIRNCRTINAGEQHIKGSRPLVGTLIENVWMENTYQRTNDGVARPDDYLGGIDIHGAIGWTIRNCVAKNIIGVNGGGDAGIFLWNFCSDCTVENNLIIGCNKGIAYGNPSNNSGTWHMDGGIIRNNFIVNLDGAGADLGIEMCFTRDCQVYNNTIYSQNPNFFRSFHIYATSSIRTVNLDLRNNIIRGRILSTNANGTWTSTGDIVGTSVDTDWFVDPLAGDLHLTRNAVPAIDQGAALLEVPIDYDGHPRPLGLAADIGADELLAGDINGDNSVDAIDLLMMASAFNTSVGHPDYDLAVDLNGDGIINAIDLLMLARCWQL